MKIFKRRLGLIFLFTLMSVGNLITNILRGFKKISGISKVEESIKKEVSKEPYTVGYIVSKKHVPIMNEIIDNKIL